MVAKFSKLKIQKLKYISFRKESFIMMKRFYETQIKIINERIDEIKKNLESSTLLHREYWEEELRKAESEIELLRTYL